MLVLSRFKGQSIVIGDDVWLRVLAIHGDKVSLGIAAPPDVPVDREEVAEAKRLGLAVGKEGSSCAS